MDFFMQKQEINEEIDLPIFKEYAIDFKTAEPIYKEGEIVILEKNEALKVWVYKVLYTKLNKYKAYSKNYGNDLIEHLGTIYDETIKKAVIEQQIKECLLVNPYILSLNNFTFEYDGYNLNVNFNVQTIYGGMEVGKIAIKE